MGSEGKEEGSCMSDKNIGETISSLRKTKGMTQSDLAEKMNVTDNQQAALFWHWF